MKLIPLDSRSSHWYRTIRWGRLQLSLNVYRHTNTLGSDHPDRWVIQPSLIYDRKKR